MLFGENRLLDRAENFADRVKNRAFGSQKFRRFSTRSHLVVKNGKEKSQVVDF